jgi:hypothetical protein
MVHQLDEEMEIVNRNLEPKSTGQVEVVSPYSIC